MTSNMLARPLPFSFEPISRVPIFRGLLRLFSDLAAFVLEEGCRVEQAPVYSWLPSLRSSGAQEAERVAFQHDAGEPPAEHRAGVDADAVRLHRRVRGGRVAMHHDEAERRLVCEKGLADGQQILPLLLLQRHAGADAGVDEQIAALPMPQAEAAHE